MKEQIEKAIESALRRESKLTTEAMEPGGFTSPEIRHLMNNLGAISNYYLEIGTHRGALSVATTYGNDIREIALVDNWSEFSETDAKEEFHKFHRKFMPTAKVIEQDCFTIEEGQVYPNVDLYLYDADHSYEAQEKGITYFEKFFAPQVIVCVDDFNWESSQKGTRMGLGYLSMKGWKVEAEWVLTGENWWNGYGVFLLKKSI